jgi:hypothetical protein
LADATDFGIDQARRRVATLASNALGGCLALKKFRNAPKDSKTISDKKTAIAAIFNMRDIELYGGTNLRPLEQEN